MSLPTAAIRRATDLTVGEAFRDRALLHPQRYAAEDEYRRLTFGELNARVNRFAALLAEHAIARGDRVAILSENRLEYLELVLAAAKRGAIVSCLNWRLSPPELAHCLELTTPRLIIASARYADTLARLAADGPAGLVFGDDFERQLAARSAAEPAIDVGAEDGLLIIFTSGTTGLPKGALISHRAELARLMLNCVDLGLAEADGFVAWAPMFHMASTEQALHTLLMGGPVISVDGFDVDRIEQAIATVRQWWLLLMPGVLDPLIRRLSERRVTPAGVKLVGALADLVPLHQIVEVTRLFDAPYLNTFGSTETGMAPASRGRLAIGETPATLAKEVNNFCQYRLLDAADRDVPDGTPGELAFRGPTLFSGYWNAPEINARDFRDGWFHMGDCFVRRADGRIDFVDRVKYMIKSGGENIYPAEIERVLLSDPRVADAVVVRAADAQWGEVPVAFVAKRDPALSVEDLETRCHAALARYKHPRAIHFVEFAALPRSTTGKIQRQEVERWLQKEPP